MTRTQVSDRPGPGESQTSERGRVQPGQALPPVSDSAGCPLSEAAADFSLHVLGLSTHACGAVLCQATVLTLENLHAREGS